LIYAFYTAALPNYLKPIKTCAANITANYSLLAAGYTIPSRLLTGSVTSPYCPGVT